MEQIIAPLPRISIQAFCETQDVKAVIQAVAEDRRAERAHIKVQMGGAEAAAEAYRNASSPNVIVIEMDGSVDAFLACLDRLAETCDPATKVLVIGHANDVLLYRDLMRRGVSDYLITPVSLVDCIRALSEIFHAPSAEPVGRTIAVMGAKGGVGASTIAHNLAWTIAEGFDVQSTIVDLDLAFGTVGLDFNQDPAQGIADAVFAQDRLDANLVDRLMTKCTERLSILAAPATLERTYDFSESSFDGILEILRAAVPCIILDMPHAWTAWSKRLLFTADEIVLVAAPDLANLRNAKNISDEAQKFRPNDHKPHLVLNQTGMAKRPEIAVNDFCKAIDLTAAAVIPFDASLFGTAANNGQMIAEMQAKGKTAEALLDLGRKVTGRVEARSARRSVLEPLLAKFQKKKA